MFSWKERRISIIRAHQKAKPEREGISTYSRASPSCQGPHFVESCCKLHQNPHWSRPIPVDSFLSASKPLKAFVVSERELMVSYLVLTKPTCWVPDRAVNASISASVMGWLFFFVSFLVGCFFTGTGRGCVAFFGVTICWFDFVVVLLICGFFGSIVAFGDFCAGITGFGLAVFVVEIDGRCKLEVVRAVSMPLSVRSILIFTDRFSSLVIWCAICARLRFLWIDWGTCILLLDRALVLRRCCWRGR